MNQNPNMNYSTMSGQEFMQRYPQGLQGYENITPQEFMREFPANNYETITPQEYFRKYAPPETITPEEYFRRYPNSGRFQRFEKPLLEAGQIGGRVTRGLGHFIPGIGAALTATDIYDGLNSPVQAGSLQPTDAGYQQASYQDLLPLIQLNNQGQPDYMLQDGVEENYMLPPESNNNMEDYYKKAKQFYGLLKANPQVPFNVFNNFILGNTKDLPGLLNGSSAGANM